MIEQFHYYCPYLPGKLSCFQFHKRKLGYSYIYTRNFPFIHFPSQNHGRYMISVLKLFKKKQHSCTAKHDWDATFFSFQEFKLLFFNTQSRILLVDSFAPLAVPGMKLTTRIFFSTPGSLGQTTTPCHYHGSQFRPSIISLHLATRTY